MIITKDVEVRFRDIDSMGHVNNAVYLNYFEQARMKYFSLIIGEKWDWQKHGMVVARQEIDYKIPVLLNDEVQLETWCEKLGNASIIFRYRLNITRNGQSSIAVKGKTILVCYDNILQKVTPVPQVWRDKVEVLPDEASE